MSDVTIRQLKLKPPRIAWILLLLQMLVVAGVLWRTGRLAPQIVPDTASYVSFPWHNLASALGDMRTPGYPLFLQLTGLAGPDHVAVPALQLLVYFLAVATMFSQLRRSTQSAAGSLAAASSLLYANIVLGYVATVAADTLAAGIAIATLALTIGWVSSPRPAKALSLALVVTLGWLVRPAYLFLVVLCPLLTGLAIPVVVASRHMTRTRLFGATLFCCVSPLLVYCGFRWAIVGQFGIVSFGGYNLIGVSGQFLEDSDLRTLPADLKPLAESALRRRRESSPRGEFASEPRLHYLRMENDYDPTIWSDFVPAAEELSGNTPINVRLRRLGTALVLRHPVEYGVWLVKAVRQGAKKLFRDFLDNPVDLFVSLIVWSTVPLVIGFSGPSRIPEPDHRVLMLSLLVAVTYATLNLATVILVCPPLGRFTDAGGVFLGMPVFTGCVLCWKRFAGSKCRPPRTHRTDAPLTR